MKPAARARFKVVHPTPTAPGPQVERRRPSVPDLDDADDVVSLRCKALRTPLDRMVAFADLVAADNISEEQRVVYASKLRRETRRLSALIDNALELQSLDAGRRELDLAPVDVRSVIGRAVKAAGEDVRHPIHVLAPERLPLVWADAEAVLGVLANFVENARRFSLSGGAVTIEARSAGDMVEVSILDHGIGLEIEELPKIFRKFYRAENGIRMRGPGAGLGLAINRRIIESHGGQVGVTSAGPGRGARFQFTLPVAQGVTKSDYVLIVEGDAAFARLLKTELASVGLETLRASDAETAQQMLAETSPGAIVLDLRFASLPGTDLIARFRTTSGTRLPSVVLADKEVSPEQLSELEKRGVIQVLPKEAGAPQAAAALIAQALMP